tara:strand:- start:20332 stop:20694 length:363 start_codon:yes stop_codon:yes gene_type:complete
MIDDQKDLATETTTHDSKNQPPKSMTNKQINDMTDEGHGCPVVHLNGSSKDALLKEWFTFQKALETARELFPNESFHGRNHYPKGDAGEQKADEYRKALLAQLDTLIHCAAGNNAGIDAQ